MKQIEEKSQCQRLAVVASSSDGTIGDASARVAKMLGTLIAERLLTGVFQKVTVEVVSKKVVSLDLIDPAKNKLGVLWNIAIQGWYYPDGLVHLEEK